MEQLETASVTNDPLAGAIRRADLAALWRAIEALPRQQRDALLLREFGGLSYGELSAALAVSGGAVESLLFRARQRLRVQLRTVYASVSGASWVDALVRLFAGGGAPVAAKVAVLGAGAAVVGGTAVVVPNVLENHRPSQRTPAAVTQQRKASTPRLVERVAPTPARPATPSRVSSEHDLNDLSQPAQGSVHRSTDAARVETSQEHSGAGGGGREGDAAQTDGQTGQTGDAAEHSSTTISPRPALSPSPSTPSEDDGDN
jgi:hypothetical protein